MDGVWAIAILMTECDFDRCFTSPRRLGPPASARDTITVGDSLARSRSATALTRSGLPKQNVAGSNPVSRSNSPFLSTDPGPAVPVAGPL